MLISNSKLIFQIVFNSGKTGSCTRFSVDLLGHGSVSCLNEKIWIENNMDRPNEHVLRPERCELELKIGHCKAAMPSYYFDKSSGMCLKFTYGGCGGNANRFLSKTECEKTCLGKL